MRLNIPRLNGSYGPIKLSTDRVRLGRGRVKNIEKMSLIRLKRRISPNILKNSKFYSTTIAQDNEEYTNVPQYPPILDNSFLKKIERKKEAEHDEIKAVKTVQEKQIKINMPKFYGFKSYLLHEDQIPYNALNFAQHITRTHLIKDSSLPEYYKDIQVDENLKSELSNELQEALLMEIDCIQRLHDIKSTEMSDLEKENIISASISKQVNRILTNSLAKKNKHLVNAQIDLDPRIESCWFVGGMNPPKNIKRCRKGTEHLKEYENDPVDRLISYTGTPTLSLRFDLPLPPIMSHSDSENKDFEVPFYHYDPRVLGIFTSHKHMANVPGFWPDDRQTFGLLSLHKRSHLIERQITMPEAQDGQEALHVQGILASYAWLHAQANYLGFNTFNDVTYPLVTQTVLTNGKKWSFYMYQLNTLLLHSRYIYENPKKNICWATEELNLYEKIEDGKIVGFNDEVMNILVRLYANTPGERLGVNLRPYLSDEEKLIADYEDDEKRQWLEREYKFLVSNHPRFKDFPEIYSWEKIYKIDHETRPMEKRMRFFELMEKPQNRRLDDRLPFYIPRKLRPYLPRNKGRYAKEFWP